MLSQPADRSHSDDDAFEMSIPSTPSYAVEEGQPKIPLKPLRPVETKKSSSTAANKNLIRWIAAALAVGAVSGFFVGSIIYRKTIDDLRIDLDRAMESFRSDIEHELGVHLMAAAAVHKAADERATKFQQHTNDQIRDFSINNAEKDVQSQASPSQTLHSYLLSQGTEWIKTIQTWLQTMKIMTMALFDWIQNKMIDLVKLANDVVAIIVEWMKNDSHHHTIADIMDRSRMMSLFVTDWIKCTSLLPAIATIVDRIQNNFSLPSMNLESLAMRNPLKDGMVFSASLRLCAFFLISCLVAYDWVVDRRSSKKDIDDSANVVRNEKENEKSEEAGSGEIIPDEVERNEDAIMEQMFYDSVALASKLPPVAAVPPISPIHSRPIYAVGHTNTNDAANDPTRPLFPPAPRTKISKKEKIRQARINAKAFAARDKLKLKNAAATNKADDVIIDVVDVVVDTPSSSQRRSSTIPSQTERSPWTAKQGRLEKARANAKLYAARDQQRLRNAMANSPWKKKGNSRQSHH